MSTVPCPERRVPGVKRRLAIPPPGQRERRADRPDRRRRDRRTADTGSPYGSERRTGADDRLDDRRGSKVDRQVGIGLARDYFAQAEARPADEPGATVPAHLLIRFNG